MGIDGLTTPVLVDGDNKGTKVRDGFVASALKPFNPENPQAFRASSRSRAPAYEMVFWRTRSDDNGFIINVDGDVMPDLVRVIACEANGAKVVEVPVNPADPDAGTKFDLDLEDFLWDKQNRGYIRVDGVLGRLPGGQAAWEDRRQYMAYGKRLLTVDALVKLMRRSVEFHPDRLPQYAPGLNALVSTLHSQTPAFDRASRGALKAGHNLVELRQTFEQAIARYKELGSPTESKPIDMAQLEGMNAAAAIAFLKARGVRFDAEEPEPEPLPEPQAAKPETFYSESFRMDLPDTAENRLADRAASRGWTPGEMTGAGMLVAGAAGFSLAHMAATDPVRAQAPEAAPSVTSEPPRVELIASADAELVVVDPLSAVLSALKAGEIDKNAAAKALSDLPLSALKAAVPSEVTVDRRNKAPLVAEILSKF